LFLPISHPSNAIMVPTNPSRSLASHILVHLYCGMRGAADWALRLVHRVIELERVYDLFRRRMVPSDLEAQRPWSSPHGKVSRNISRLFQSLRSFRFQMSVEDDGRGGTCGIQMDAAWSHPRQASFVLNVSRDEKGHWLTIASLSRPRLHSRLHATPPTPHHPHPPATAESPTARRHEQASDPPTTDQRARRHWHVHERHMATSSQRLQVPSQQAMVRTTPRRSHTRRCPLHSTALDPEEYFPTLAWRPEKALWS
jgi:hypothetical protein